MNPIADGVLTPPTTDAAAAAAAADEDDDDAAAPTAAGVANSGTRGTSRVPYTRLSVESIVL